MAAASFNRVHLSEGDAGKGVTVSTGSGITKIHESTNTANQFDEVWLWVCETSGTDQTATIYSHRASEGVNAIASYVVPANTQFVTLLPGLTVSDEVAIWVAATGLQVVGHVNRILNQ